MGGHHINPKRFPIPAVEPGQPHCTEMLESRSRFLAQSCHCETGEQAKQFVADIRMLNPGATHNCWAYVAGPPGDTAHIGSSDDGEPHGTAGKPMLNVLLHSGIGEICVVVSRWFGGIKLGTGGLARAYQGSALQNLQSLPVKESMLMVRLNLEMGYGMVNAVKRLISRYEGITLRENYQANVNLLVLFPADRIDSFRLEAQNTSKGEIKMEVLGN